MSCIDFLVFLKRGKTRQRKKETLLIAVTVYIARAKPNIGNCGLDYKKS